MGEIFEVTERWYQDSSVVPVKELSRKSLVVKHLTVTVKHLTATLTLLPYREGRLHNITRRSKQVRKIRLIRQDPKDR